jgi:hypothetical protein
MVTTNFSRIKLVCSSFCQILRLIVMGYGSVIVEYLRFWDVTLTLGEKFATFRKNVVPPYAWSKS